MSIPFYDFPSSPILIIGALGIAVAVAVFFVSYQKYFNSPLNKERAEKTKSLIKEQKELNERLEARFEANEKQLAELEESLQIKIGVLGELFGVTRQFAGELLASTEKAVTFSEYPDRGGVLSCLLYTSPSPRD